MQSLNENFIISLGLQNTTCHNVFSVVSAILTLGIVEAINSYIKRLNESSVKFKQFLKSLRKILQ